MSDAFKTQWGGLIDRRCQASGFFRTAHIDGAWWLIDPAGGRFLSKGVNTVCARPDRIRNSNRIPYAAACRRKYRTVNAWRAAAARRLSAFGFNTIGAWSDEEVALAGPLPLATTPVLHLADEYLSRQAAPLQLGSQIFPDVFDRKFDTFVSIRTRKVCAQRRDDPHLIGWFSDNELHWTADWRGSAELLTAFLNLPANRPGRKKAIAFLRERYSGFAAFNEVWRTDARNWRDLSAIIVAAPFTRDPPYQQSPQSGHRPANKDPRRNLFFTDCDVFAGLVAERYFAVTIGAIKAADPNHLALGCRFAYPPQPAVIAAAGHHLDVISFNCYDDDPARAIAAYARLQKPCLIGEFSFRAADSGLPNTNGAGLCVATQTERAHCYHSYVRAAFQHGAVVGCHWFEHVDQPAQGRFDGENSNYGIVTINDDLYDELARAMILSNRAAENIHASKSRALSSGAADARADAHAGTY